MDKWRSLDEDEICEIILNPASEDEDGAEDAINNNDIKVV